MPPAQKVLLHIWQVHIYRPSEESQIIWEADGPGVNRRFTVLDHADLRRLHKSEFEQDRDFAFNFMKDMFRQSSDGWGSGHKRKHTA